MNKITRLQAKSEGRTRFFTGKICRSQHVEERLVSTGECVQCKRDRSKQKYSEDSSGYKKYYLANRERLLAQQKIVDDARRDEKIEYGRQWRKDNPEYSAMYLKVRADKYRFHSAKRRAVKRQATPLWFEDDAVHALYTEAERISVETGIPHEVDHIVPLINENVCGLHCLANLQILTETENRQKTNKFVPQ